MSQWYDRIVAALQTGRFNHVSLVSDQARLLISEHGARVLACQMPGVEENLFFHPPFMEAAQAGGAMAGGDRLWIAPEVGWFWPSLDEARRDPKGAARTPVAIDPGYYQFVSTADDEVVMDNRVDVTDGRDGRQLALYVNRAVRLLGRPEGWPQQVASVSFAVTNTLTWADQTTEPGAVAGCWDILQVPPTGTLVCPTTRRVEPTSYYEPFGERHVVVDDRRVRFRIDGRHRIKMGLPADATTGRMGYLRMVDGQCTLIVRVFPSLPGEPYCDLPRDASADRRLGGDALQAYNDDGDAFPGTTFGEMEYHDPCLIAGAAPETRTGTSVTHVLVGPEAAVRAVGEDLLGASLDPVA